MDLGRQLAVTREARLGHDVALEARGDRRIVEGKHDASGTLGAEIGQRGQLDAEIDGLILPNELAGAGERIGESRKAHIRIDMLDAPLGALLVIDDVDRTVLDAHVLEPDVALRLVVISCGGLGEMLALAGIAPLGGRRVLAETQRKDRAYQDDALGIDLAAEQLAEGKIELEPANGDIGGAGARLGIGDGRVGDDDVRTRREEERGRAVDLELAAGLLLDARGDAVAHPIRRDEEIDGDERDDEDADEAARDLEEKLRPWARAQAAAGSAPAPAPYGSVDSAWVPDFAEISPTNKVRIGIGRPSSPSAKPSMTADFLGRRQTLAFRLSAPGSRGCPNYSLTTGARIRPRHRR